MSDAAFVRVARVADVPRGRMLEVSAGARSILLCHTRDGWFAVDNICTHAYAKLSEGHLRKSRLICPLHGGAFDCRSGMPVGAPAALPLARYPVRVSGEDVEIDLSGPSDGS
jgi:nitrite reductase/ring-hydroxylating ferredoxin subunit